MLKAAPPIQAPAASILGEVCSLIESGKLTSGPLFHFDPATGVFLVALVEQGVIVHWQLESCHDREDAARRIQNYRQGFVEEAFNLLQSNASCAAGGAGTLQ